MLVRLIQKLALYTKEVQDTVLFGLMSDSQLFSALSASPILYTMLPFIGILMTITAIINGYHLAKASNKNFDQWFNFITSVGCAILASISLYGAALAAIYDFTFVAGPWFFFGSSALAFMHQSVMFGLNLYRAYESLSGSAQRMHYVQAALNNLFMMGLLTAVIGAVTFVMLFPAVAPALGSVFALTAVAFTLLDIAWRVIPHNWKLFIKGLLFLGKPESTLPQAEVANAPELVSTLDSNVNNEAQHHRLFTRPDYSAAVREMTKEKGKEYLHQVIIRKIAVLDNPSVPQTDKTRQKVDCLSVIERALESHTKIDKADLLEKYPLVFQNFWSEKSDVEQILDAAKLVIAKFEQRNMVVDVPVVELDAAVCRL
ncbi:hypothetical protein [Legionella fallonii]|uniref:Uncharacterized protein n=1 Tax=Legionella fallonii LLAP-10 TaxID=1212491 RepID=A0A098G4S3_9GAMM|nr:hypothetical protein [Legionella fallonii]CEG56485.1 conserved membrane protein of unknown function [Legionella fallonii LLAP-10]